MEAAVEIACSRAFGGRLEAGWREKRSCSIIRNYTHLPPFITSFWAVTLRPGMRTKSPRRHQDTEPSRAWNQDGETAEGRRLAAKEHTESKGVGNGGLESWSNGVPEGWGGQKRVRLFSKWEKG